MAETNIKHLYGSLSVKWGKDKGYPSWRVAQYEMNKKRKIEEHQRKAMIKFQKEEEMNMKLKKRGGEKGMEG